MGHCLSYLALTFLTEWRFKYFIGISPVRFLVNQLIIKRCAELPPGPFITVAEQNPLWDGQRKALFIVSILLIFPIYLRKST